MRKAKSLIIIIAITALFSLSGCHHKEALPAMKMISADQALLAEEEVQMIIDNLDIDSYRECGYMNKETWYGTNPYLNLEVTDGEDKYYLNLNASPGFVTYRNVTYAADPYDKLFDVVREICLNHGYPVFSIYTELDRPVRLSGLFEYDPSIKDDVYYPDSNDYYFSTATAAENCLISDCLAIFEIAYDGSETIGEVFREAVSADIISDSLINREIIFHGMKIKLVATNNIDHDICFFLLKKDS